MPDPNAAGAFVVGSSRGHDQLAVWIAKPGTAWRARIECADLRAEATVRERFGGDTLGLDAFFAGLAQDWRGWNGDRAWEALGLRLSARHDGLGHITLDATLEPEPVEADRWRVRASLLVDAGALDRLAVAARALDAA